MKVLYAVSNWAGHYYPMVPLGRALGAAGHEVRVACTPLERTAIEATGLTAVPVLDAPEIDRIARVAGILQLQSGTWPYPSPPPHPLTGAPVHDPSEVALGPLFASFGPIARRGVEAAVALVEQWRPDLIVHDLLSFEGRFLGAYLDVPALPFLWGPIGTHEHKPEYDYTPNDYSNAFAGYGVDAAVADRPVAVLDPCPDALRPGYDVPGIAIRYEPVSGANARDVELPPALTGERRRPRVCLVWGTSVSRIFGLPNSPVPTVVRALAQSDLDLVVTLSDGDRGLVGAMPDNVTVLDYAPLEDLLPHCDVVIHSGGGGCTMTSVLTGTPQFVLPNGLDQPLNAERLVAAGVARSVAAHAVTEEDVRTAVHELITDPSYAQAAERLRRSAVSRPQPIEVVPLLEQIAAGRRDLPRTA